MGAKNLKVIVATALSAVVAILFCFAVAPLAHADDYEESYDFNVTTEFGKRAYLWDVEYSRDYCGALSVSYSDESIATVRYDKSEDVLYIDPAAFGHTTIVISFVEKLANTKVHYAYTINASVKDATISKKKCDLLFTGRTYTAKKLGSDAGLAIKGGHFIKGSGYKVVSDGSEITLTKVGAVNVKYSAGGFVNLIKLAAVHSYDAIDKVAVKKVKSACWRPDTFRLISKKQYKVYCNVRFSAENLYHDRVTQTLSVGYKDGKIQIFW